MCHSLGPQCPYFERASFIAKHYYGDPSIPKESTLDIEDLYDLGVKKRCCPYFLSRDTEITLRSQVVFLPYNYIMDPFIRSTLPFDMKECTVIIDEAHNIVGVTTC
jgi:fanconi anemia group J protein homolog